MRTDLYTTDLDTKAVLTVIAILLAALVFRSPTTAQAQSGRAYDVYIEPGFTTLHKPDGTMQVPGKIVVDRLTGDIWGFPTLSGGIYPMDTTTTKPPVSSPMYLGKFDFSAMQK
jgi:hypothetical protein